MDKSMLIVDTPECCERCDLCVLHSDYISLEYECRGTKVSNGYVKVHPKIDRKLLNKRQDWCPLREAPENMQDINIYTLNFCGEYVNGYNACIDEILGN